MTATEPATDVPDAHSTVPAGVVSTRLPPVCMVSRKCPSVEVRESPAGRVSAETSSLRGVTVNEACALPAAVFTTIGPVAAPAGTRVRITVELTTVNRAATLPNRTDKTFTKPAPDSFTFHPGAPSGGETDLITGTEVAVIAE